MLNTNFLRAELLKQGISIKQLADEIGISQQGLNKRILNSKLYITDIFLILKKLDAKFEDVFKEG